MNTTDILDCIGFFKKLNIDQEEVTTSNEKANGLRAIKATYTFQSADQTLVYCTKPLYYKSTVQSSSVKNPERLNRHFGEEVYWLDMDKHPWPKGEGEAELEHIVIQDMADGNTDFEDFLKKIANNQKTGWLQKITMDGRGQQYGFNLLNNNHWHDLILLVKAFIGSNGLAVDEKFYSPLVFKWNWQDENRSSLSPAFGSRKLVTDLQNNLKSISSKLHTKSMINLLKHKYQIILQGPPGTGKTRLAKEIAGDLVKENNQKITTKVIKDYFKIGQIVKTKYNEQFRIADINESRFMVAPLKAKHEYSVKFEEVLKAIEHAASGKDVSESNTSGNGSYIIGIAKELEDNYLLWKYAKLIQFHPSYTYEDFVRGMVAVPADNGVAYKVLDRVLAETAKEATENPAANYVLILDEINRANLPAVLGELIYALEYRGQAVNSLYAKEGDDVEGNGNELILPKNLYIIGTMNTADRSVGQIDYAIRRRFAFVDILPKDLEGKLEQGYQFASDSFKDVAELFVKAYNANTDYTQMNTAKSDHLSEEFHPKEVWLGHSYFIHQGDFETKLNYEIKPLLREYVQDGILKASATDIIENLTP